MHRWHNVLAERALKDHPDWSDEEIFLYARRWVIASLQVSMLEEKAYRLVLQFQRVLPRLTGQHAGLYGDEEDEAAWL